MPRTKSPRDLTGLNAERMAAANARELKAREGEMSRITPYDFDDEYSEEAIVYENPTQKIAADNEEGFIEVEVPLVEFRVNTDLEAVTIGVGTSFDFEIGKLYKYPVYIRDYLEEKSLIWH